jgi:cardiolipin synthase A/B
MNGPGTTMNRFLPGNRITLLRDGAQYFPALVRAIDGAQREVWLET